MTTATIAVRGSASDEFPADFANVQFAHDLSASARSEALAGGNAVIAALRDLAERTCAGVRDLLARSLRVEEMFNFVGPDHVREHTGWTALIEGNLLVEPEAVASVVAELIKTGVTIQHLSWHLDRDTESKARRAVRRLAVADAADAAADFASALGATLADLITLSDPGLFGAAQFHSATRASAHMGIATAAMSAPSWEGHVNIDPGVITVSANVEASYAVTLGQ